MILNRLIWQSIREYLGLNEPRPTFGRKKPKPEPYETKLNTDKRLNFFVSILMSILGVLLWITMPFAILESPCEIFKQRKMYKFYKVAKWFQRYMPMMDRLTISFGILLAVVSIYTITDGIKNTKINISPWVKKGKYSIGKKPPVEQKIPDRRRFSFKKTKKRISHRYEYS